MATYKLIPSSWAGDATITDPSNAYTDTTSTTYAGVDGTATKYAYLGGFDFSVIPQDYIVTGLTVKIKAQGVSTSTSARLYSDVAGTSLASNVTLSSDSAQVYTFSLTASIDTILGYSSTLCIRIWSPYQNPSSVYGAEIIVEAVKPRNKIIYGNETLIDLTGDTATEADVAVGKIFHLASGMIATGIMQGVEVESGTWSPTSDVYKATLNFSKTHTVPPAAFLVYDVGATAATNNSNILICGADFNALFDSNYDGGYYTSDGGIRAFKVNIYRYSGSDNSSVSKFSTGRDGSGESGYRYYANESSINAMGSTSSYLWRRARTYKWIAIWV